MKPHSSEKQSSPAPQVVVPLQSIPQWDRFAKELGEGIEKAMRKDPEGVNALVDVVNRASFHPMGFIYVARELEKKRLLTPPDPARFHSMLAEFERMIEKLDPAGAAQWRHGLPSPAE